MNSRSAASLILACVLAGVVAAGPAAAADADAAAPAVPSMNCPQPAPPPEKNATAQQIDTYNKALPEYRQCVKTYVDARSADARKYNALTQANNKAAEAAVAEFNRFAKQVSPGQPAAASSATH